MNKRERFIYYSSPEHWFQTALELGRSIEELYETREKYLLHQNLEINNFELSVSPQNSRAIYLLMAYTLENLLKGIHILRDAKLISSGKLDSKIKTHDLIVLADELKFKNSEKEKKFQEYLSNLCVSLGRYPIGKNEHNSLNSPNIEEDDYKIYKKLFLKYSSKLTSEFAKNGWDSGMDNEILNTKPKAFRYVSFPDLKK